MANNIESLVNLMNDTTSGRVEMFHEFENEKKAKKLSEKAIREGFYEILGGRELTPRIFRNHKNEIFTVIEEYLDSNLPLAWNDSPFYEEFVDIKNMALGDKNEFVTEDTSVLIASEFAGNHWDTDRKKLPGKKSFSLPTTWIYVRVYDDLERFLKGYIDLATMTTRMQDAMRRAIDSKINTSFAAAGSYLPPPFVESGTYDKETMLELIDRVQVATQKNVVIAGTHVGLARIIDTIDAKWISEEQKREMATSGKIVQLTGLGVYGVEIPQSFVRGTYNFAVNNKLLYVLPADEKFIKVVFEGNTRALDLNEMQTHDQTIDIQTQTKVGVGVVFNNYFGRWQLP